MYNDADIYIGIGGRHWIPPLILSYFLVLAVAIAILSVPKQANAHYDINASITLLDERIATTPDDYTHYLRRGELHRLHDKWSLALADYQQAQALHPRPVDVDFYTGRMWLDAGQPSKALFHLNRFLHEHPDNAQALLVRAHALEALGKRIRAADDLAFVIRTLAQPTPDIYIKWADLLVSEGDKHLDDGIQVIEEGIARLGPVVSMIQYAVGVGAAHKRYQKALGWIDTLPEALQSQPRWLAQRGDILAAAGRHGEAHKVFGAALSALEHNSHRRQTSANAALEAELRMKSSSLGSQTDGIP